MDRAAGIRLPRRVSRPPPKCCSRTVPGRPRPFSSTLRLELERMNTTAAAAPLQELVKAGSAFNEAAIA